MIVRTLDRGTLLITQPDHAQLARTVLERCTLLTAHPRRASLLTAIGEHDNGWTEEDAAPTVDPATGSVIDFVTAPLEVRHRVWPRGVGRLAGDPWAAALVAQHALTVYERFRGDPEWAAFFDRMSRQRDAMVQASGLSSVELEADYPFVRLGDLISLTFCTGWTEAQSFAPWTVALAGTLVRVTPDPFDGVVIPVGITAMEIRRGPFASTVDLRQAIAAGTTTALRGDVSGGG